MNMNKTWLLMLGALLTLGGCASSSPDVIKREDAQRLQNVQDGVVLSVREVVIDGSQSGTGAAAGGVVGALAGYGVGRNQTEAQIVGIAGALAGAVAGNAIERAGTKEDAVEILVQLRGGERRAIVQAKGGEVLQPGDAVVLITGGGKVRVAKAPK